MKGLLNLLLVATICFTAWVEVKTYQEVTKTDVIHFHKEMIIHRFGITQSITVDQLKKKKQLIKIQVYTQDYALLCSI